MLSRKKAPDELQKISCWISRTGQKIVAYKI
jgi:hypothetical protein